MGIPTILVKPAGVRAWLRVYWEGCVNEYGLGRSGIHNAQILIGDLATDGVNELGGRGDEANAFGGQPEDYAPDRWPSKCDHCDAVVPADGEIHRQVFRRTLYAPALAGGTPRELQVGDLYFATWGECDKHGGKCVLHRWTNCDGRHLHCILPDGDLHHGWNIDGRASNCTLPDDTTHRCWRRHGDPEKGERVHVDKNGETCNAGAGSIQSRDFHGFLHNGEITT